jgi:anti-sigma regulatory factor (Ser/Thr protein kinase)/anti-anti-sigma regulatory factor
MKKPRERGRRVNVTTLETLCAARNWRWADLVWHCPVARSTFAKMRRGEPVDDESIRKVAKFLGVAPPELWAIPSPDTMSDAPQPSAGQTTAEAPPGGAEAARVAPSPEAPAVSVSVPLFDRRKMESEYYPAIEQAMVGRFGWPVVSARMAISALNELMTNGFMHGCRGAGEQEVSYSASVERGGEELVMTVRSPGKGFDVARVLRESVERGIGASGGEGGRGLYLVKQFSRELIASWDGRVIQVVIDRQPRRADPSEYKPWVRSYEGRNIAFVTLPRTLSWMQGFEFDQAAVARTIEAENVIGGILDMLQNEHIDSPLLGKVINVRKPFQKKGLPFASVVSPIMMELFRVARLDQVFNAFLSMQECVDYVLGAAATRQ